MYSQTWIINIISLKFTDACKHYIIHSARDNKYYLPIKLVNSEHMDLFVGTIIITKDKQANISPVARVN